MARSSDLDKGLSPWRIFSAAFTPVARAWLYGDQMTQHIKNSVGNRLLVLAIAAVAAVFYALYKARLRGR